MSYPQAKMGTLLKIKNNWQEKMKIGLQING